LNPEKLGISMTNKNAVFGVVMDTGYSIGWATLVAFSDGNASLYLSNGGGVMGGAAHETVRKAAISMINAADRYVDQTTITESTPLPTSGNVTFYLLTTNAIRAATAKEDDLGEQRHALAPLFNAGQEVITQLRLISENK
jgi:hypothetical protein